MNEQIRELAKQCYETGPLGRDGWPEYTKFNEVKFAELIKQAIYDKVKEELIEDEYIVNEPDRLTREYLKGCNGGTVDALCHIKNFGVEE